VTLHVEVAGSEPPWPAVVDISGHRQRFEKHLRHDHRGAYVDHHSTVVEPRECGSKPAKVAVPGVSNGCAVGRRVLMDNFSAQRRMDGIRHPEPERLQKERKLGMCQISAGVQISGECFSHSPLGLQSRAKSPVHVAPGFFGHAEASVRQSSFHVFAGAPPPGHLVVVDRRATVGR